MVLVLRWVHPPATSFMLFGTRSDEPLEYRWTDWQHIGSKLPIAVVAAEDQKFPDHWGFDLEQIRKALRANQRHSRQRGASTITQQVAKNLFLWPGRSYWRKGLEAYFTVLIEMFWSKQRILEMYVNIAQFGPGVYGVGAASRKYFAKPPKSLNTVEVSLLAAVLPNPRRLKVDRPSPYVHTRAKQIRRQIEQLGGARYLNAI